MQPTDHQVQRSLAALQAGDHSRTQDLVPRRGAVPRTDLPPGVLEMIEKAPAVRAERLEAARTHLAAGEVPSADDLADRMVGRLVCDRLR